MKNIVLNLPRTLKSFHMRSSATLAVCDNEALEAIMCSDKGGELEQKSNSAQFDDSANAEDNKNNSLIRNVTTTLRKNSSDAGDSSSSLIPDQNISCSASLGQENDHVSEEACINLMNAISKKSAEERQKSEEERSDDSGIGKNFRAAIEAPLLTEYVVTNPTTIGVEAHEESSYKISGHKDRFGTNSWRCGPKKTHDSVLSPGCPRASCTPSQTENNFVNSKPEHSVHGISGEQIESLSQFRSVAKSISRTESAPAFEEPKLAENLHETLQPTELVDAVSEQLNSVNDPANEEEAGLFGKMYTAVSPEQRILLKTYAGTTGGYYPLRMTAGSCGSDPALENQQVQRSNHPFVYLVEEYSNALHQRYTASKSHIEDSIAVESLDIEIPAQLDHLGEKQILYPPCVLLVPPEFLQSQRKMDWEWMATR